MSEITRGSDIFFILVTPPSQPFLSMMQCYMCKCCGIYLHMCTLYIILLGTIILTHSFQSRTNHIWSCRLLMTTNYGRTHESKSGGCEFAPALVELVRLTQPFILRWLMKLAGRLFSVTEAKRGWVNMHNPYSYDEFRFQDRHPGHSVLWHWTWVHGARV